MEEIKRGNTILFGDYWWHVLNVKNDKAVLLCEKIIGRRRYNIEFSGSSWETCALRRYLNEEFYNQFNVEQKKMIAETKLNNLNNQWFGTRCGNDTYDKIFILSICEVIEYLGNSGQLRNINPKKNEWLHNRWIDDKFNSCRIAKDEHESPSWWWLRSQGLTRSFSTYVLGDGSIDMRGYDVDSVFGGVRPALIIKLSSVNIEPLDLRLYERKQVLKYD